MRATARAGPTRVGTTMRVVWSAHAMRNLGSPVRAVFPYGPKWRRGTSLGVRKGHNRTHARAGPEWEESPDRANRLNSSTPVREGWRGP